MSIAIVLGGWFAASLLLSPLIGRFLSAREEGEYRSTPHQIPSRPTPSSRLRCGTAVSMRRNVAIHLSRREAGWPRAG
jgi:hypothetical protein